MRKKKPTNLLNPFHFLSWRVAHLIALISSVLLFFVVQLSPSIVQAAPPLCVEDIPDDATYVVTLCLSEPLENETLSGEVSVTVDIQVEGEDPGIQRVMFYLDEDEDEDEDEDKEEYLLTDYSPPYSFLLPSASYANGVHTLSVELLMRDKFLATGPNVKVRFKNDEPQPEWPAWQVATAEPEPDEPLIVTAVGDGISGRPEMYDVVELIDSWKPDLFLYLGDVYDKGSPTEFYNWYDGAGKSYGRFRDITNPIIGNHEYLSGKNKGEAYFDYWGGVPDYYSFDSGGWHFVALNSNCSKFADACSPDSLQFQWLEEELRTNESACTLVYFHHPVVSIGSHGGNSEFDDMWRLFAQQDVDVVLTGHDHNYQRWQRLNAQMLPNPSGITQFVVGSGGHGIRSFTSDDARVAFADDSRKEGFGALRLQLYESGVEYQFINTAGEIRDEGQVRCHTSSKSALDPIPLLAYYEMSFNQTVWEDLSDRSSLGRYSSDDVDVMRQQMRLAQDAGITGFIVSWHDTPELNRRLAKLIEVAQEEAFELAIRYDSAGTVNSLEEMATELAYLAALVAEEPVFAGFERPLVIWPDLAYFTQEEVIPLVEPLREQILIISEGSLAEYEWLTDIVDGHTVNQMHTLNEEQLIQLSQSVHKRGDFWLAPASSAGIAQLVGEEMEAQPRTDDTLRQRLNLAIQSAPDAIGLISWNDFANNTHIEPSQQYGTSTLDLLKELNQINSPTVTDFDSNAPAATTPQPTLDIMRFAAIGVLIFLVLLSVIVILRRAITS